MANLAELRESDPNGELPSFSWPGAYPMTYYTEDGLTICPRCANDADTSDPVIDAGVYWEGPPDPCGDCGEMIESAYGDPDSDSDSDPDHAHVNGIAAVRVLADTSDPVEGYDPIQRCDLCAAFDSDNAAARAVAIARFGTDGDLTAVLYTDGQPFVLVDYPKERTR